MPALEMKADLVTWHINPSEPKGWKIDNPEVAIDVTAEIVAHR